MSYLSPNRRQLLAGAAGLAGTALTPPVLALAARSDPLVLTARPGRAMLLEPSEPETAIWGYEGGSPGPLIRAQKGGEVAVRLVNGLDVPTTVHWHGIRIDNTMDGVAHLTQEPVLPGESFDYRFTVPDAGTFWYHPHVHGSGPQVGRGLYGLLVVDEAEPIDVDRDVPLVFDDWRIGDDGQIDAASFGNLHDAAHGGRLGNILTVNGRFLETVTARAGERLRLRVASTCNARILQLDFSGLDPWVIAVDGQPLPPYRLGTDDLVLSPGQRIDLAADIDGAPGARIVVAEVSGDPFEAMVVEISGDAARPVRKDGPAALPANPVAPVNGRPERVVDLVMAGGAMSFLGEATYEGQTYDGRTLATEHGMVWAMNGIAGMPEAPLLSAKAGEPVAIRFVNDSVWPHAMHLHGHHFVVLEGPGSPTGALRDTILVEPRSETTVAFVADNPGRWMIHCHMLEHQASGMESWFEVLA